MADTFNGTTSGNFGTVGNWDTGNVPGTGASETSNMAGTSTSVTSGLDRSASNALAEMIIHNTMLGDIGNSSADPLIIDAARLTFDGRGSSYYFKGDYTDCIIQGTSSQSVSLNDGGGVGETIGDVWIHGAAATTIEASAELDQLFMGLLAGAVTIGAGVTATDLNVGGGFLDSSAAGLTAYVQGGGKLTLSNSGSGTITVRSGGTLELLTDATVSAITLEPGARLITKNNANIPTITTLNEYFGSTHDLDSEPQRVAIGTRNRFGFPAPLT